MIIFKEKLTHKEQSWWHLWVESVLSVQKYTYKEQTLSFLMGFERIYVNQQFIQEPITLLKSSNY